ncbi:MAG TPA: pilus assembly protein TadG-related protein [Acidimicrobiia bacterium]|nr:pilus assembly protein TadG-related protein [Acidimicrobiia bacterium]
MNSEEGTMTMAMSGAIVIVAFLAVAVVGIGTLYAARAQATNAADAAALAAAVGTYPPASDLGPLAAAIRAARANGAEVAECLCAVNPGLVARTVEVVTSIEVDIPIFGPITVRSAGRAEFDPQRWLGG